MNLDNYRKPMLMLIVGLVIFTIYIAGIYLFVLEQVAIIEEIKERPCLISYDGTSNITDSRMVCEINMTAMMDNIEGNTYPSNLTKTDSFIKA